MLKILLTFMLLLNVALYADEVPYKLDITRDGKVSAQVAYNFWSGEYPSPVINVHAGTDGKTTIEGYVSLRKKEERKVCTVKNGLYHPWSKDENSYINFYTIVPIESYKVLVELPDEVQSSFSDPDLKVGDEIRNIVYLAEGESQGIIHGDKRADEIIYFQVNIFENNPKIFQRIENISTLEKNEQWLYLKCDEEYNIFVEDVDLLEQEGIKEGQITGYKSVSP